MSHSPTHPQARNAVAAADVVLAVAADEVCQPGGPHQ